MSDSEAACAETANGTVHGFADERFAALRERFEANIASGGDLGASVCVTLEGETVVDLWGGWADEAQARPWQNDTIVNVYSSTKTVTALTALMLADRGELDYDAPVARYWPEFAANGKADMKVWHLMTHTSGLPGWTETMSRDDVYDWKISTDRLAAQAPYWKDGEKRGYHALTQGYLVGEVIRRITGKTIGTFFREEIAGPLGADFYIGLPETEDHRVAEMLPPSEELTANMPEETARIMSNPGLHPVDTRLRAWRGAEMPAVNGTANARGMAKIMALLANGGVAKGRRFLSEAACNRALEVAVDTHDCLVGVPVRTSIEFNLRDPRPGVPVLLPHDRSIWGGGFGGSLLIADYDGRLSFGYAMNRMHGGIHSMEWGSDLAADMWRAVKG